MAAPDPCPEGASRSPTPELLDSGGFTEVQLAQLCDVLRDTIEGSVRAAVRMEFQALNHGQAHDHNDWSPRSSSQVFTRRTSPPVVKENTQMDASGLSLGGSLSHRRLSLDGSSGSHDHSHPSGLKYIIADLVHNPSKLEGLDTMSRAEWFQYRAKKLIKGTRFDAIMGIVIVANSVVIAIETQLSIRDAVPDYLAWVESVFLVCFILELIVRWVADGSENLKLKWFWFDFSLVFSGVVSTWIIEPLKTMTDLDEVPVLSQVLALRVVRLMRLVRALRVMEQFHELRELTLGLSRSLYTMLSVCLLVFVVVFVFACMGMETFTTSERLAHNEVTREIVRERFSSLPMAMTTLMQFANSDSISSIYVPICQEEPLFGVYFLLLWLVVTVALMNLVTAIIVENAMRHGKDDTEEKQIRLRKVVKRIIPDIEQVFDRLDVDGSQTLTHEEIEAATFNGELVLPDEIREFVAPERLIDIFEFLDTDRSGDITREEFVDGVCSLAVSAVPVEMTQILQLVRQTHVNSLDMQRAMQELLHKLPVQHARSSPLRSRDLPS